MKIGFGRLEERSRFSPAGDLSQLAGGESAQQVEPGELGMALETPGQMGLGLAWVCRPAIELADRQEALSPEMFRLGFESLIEMPFRLRQIAAFVLLEAAQEVVECAVRLDLLGRRSFLLGSLDIAGPLQADCPLQVVRMSGPVRRAASRVPGSGAPGGPDRTEIRRAEARRRPPPAPSASRSSRGQLHPAPVRSVTREVSSCSTRRTEPAGRREDLEARPVVARTAATVDLWSMPVIRAS